MPALHSAERQMRYSAFKNVFETEHHNCLQWPNLGNMASHNICSEPILYSQNICTRCICSRPVAHYYLTNKLTKAFQRNVYIY